MRRESGNAGYGADAAGAEIRPFNHATGVAVQNK